jgi:hypothetical protein
VRAGAGVEVADGVSPLLTKSPVAHLGMDSALTRQTLMKINAQHLVDLANTNLGDSLLPEIVRRLIRASAIEVAGIRFPSGESTFQPGADGELHAKGIPPYVPDGYSIWEFSAEKSIAAKVVADFDKRSDPLALDEYMGQKRDQISYVAVTLRRWTQTKGITRTAFLKQAKQRKVWKDVLVIDAENLEEWLDQSPSVTAWLLYKLGRATPDMRSIEQYWDDYRLGCNPQLSEELLLAGRKVQSEMLVSKGLSPEVVRLKADSPEESAAFVAATFLSLDKDHPVRSAVLAKGVVIERREAMNGVMDAKAFPYVVALSDAAQNATKLSNQGFSVVVPVGNSSWSTRGASPIDLPRARKDVFAEALVKMGIPQPQADTEAIRCNRSVTVFRRTHDEAQSNYPAWADRAQLQMLIAPIFVGAWNHTSEADLEVLARIAGRPPEEVENAVRNHLQVDDPPLLRAHELTALSAPADIWQISIDRHVVDRETLERFRLAAIEVLGEIDPALDLPPDQRVYASLHAKERRYSAWLRQGICETLRILAVNDDFRPYPGFFPQLFVDELAGQLFAGGVDHRVFASLDSLLPDLAEAAPRPFLQALETLMGGDGSQLSPLFEGSDDVMFGRSYYLGVLRGLEVLAWSPVYLERATLTLGRMAELDPGGKLSNRPINSLADIFLPWNPSTNAGAVARHAALNKVCEAHPSIAWELIKQLLPGGKDTSFGTSRPEWREFDASSRSEPTHGSVRDDYLHAVSLARTLVGSDGSRWVDLITAIAESGNIELLRELLIQMTAAKPDLDQSGSSGRLWEGLRSLTDRHRSFADAEWAMSHEALQLIAESVEQFQPKDPVALYKRLFDSDRMWEREPGETFEQAQERLSVKRDEAIGLLLPNHADKVLELARSAKNMNPIAGSIVRVASPETCRELVLSTAGRQAADDWFAAVLSTHAESKFGVDWAKQTVEDAELSGASPEQVATLMFLLDDKATTIELVEARSNEAQASYWRRRDAMVRSDDKAYVEMVVSKLSKYGRNVDLIEFVGYEAKHLPTNLIMSILALAYDELAAGSPRVERINSYWLRELFKDLAQRDDVDRDVLMSLEYRWLPALHSYTDTQQLALHSYLGESPEFFVEVLSDLYKASEDEPESLDADHQSTDEEVHSQEKANRAARASHAYKLLESWQELPWRREDGTIDFDRMNAWIHRVSLLARGAKREGVGMREVGKLLAYAKPDKTDNVWPEREVRRLLEEAANPQIESALILELFNKRGAHWRPIEGGGAQERQLAADARRDADILRAEWPRTANMLLESAKQWERHAEWEDNRAAEEQLRP